MSLPSSVAAVLTLVALAASACLSATPPKTPNQRAVERDAPHVVPPPPPDVGRVPRPAPDATSLAPASRPRQ